MPESEERRIVNAADLAPQHREYVAAFLRKTWNYFGPGEVSDLDTRIRNSHGLMRTLFVGNVPRGFLEPYCTDTGGVPEAVPSTMHSLTHNLTWKGCRKDGDTLILVDATKDPDYRGKGVAKDLIEEILKCPVRYVFTYSPALDHVIEIHKSLGAVPTRKILRARPGLVMDNSPAEDVMIMRYR